MMFERADMLHPVGVNDADMHLRVNRLTSKAFDGQLLASGGRPCWSTIERNEGGRGRNIEDMPSYLKRRLLQTWRTNGKTFEFHSGHWSSCNLHIHLGGIRHLWTRDRPSLAIRTSKLNPQNPWMYASAPPTTCDQGAHDGLHIVHQDYELISLGGLDTVARGLTGSSHMILQCWHKHYDGMRE